jgi:hypothetical protein
MRQTVDSYVWARQHRPWFAGYLSVFDFPQTPVAVNFDDGSFVCFDSAFFVQEDEFLVIYTEHQGYHVFLLSDDDRIITGEERDKTYIPDDDGKEYWIDDGKERGYTN